MKKIILAPDSFKGTLSSLEITTILDKVIKEKYPNIEIHKLPIADGGENSLEVIQEIVNGLFITKNVCGPNFNNINSKYLIKDKTAYIEMAQVVGLHLCDTLDCKETTTLGIGTLIKDAINNGCNKIVLFVGGSSTNDCGVGMLSELGVEFYNKNNEKFIPVCKNIDEINKIDFPKKDYYKNIKFVVLSDVQNPLLGINGATYTYAKQKGLKEEEFELIDKKIEHFTKILNNNYEFDSTTGAGGGIIYGLKSFFNCEIISGIDYILDSFNFDELLDNTDYVITGEGKIDHQTIYGKVISGICKRAKRKNVKVIALCGIIGENIEELFNMGLTNIYSINEPNITFEEAKRNAKRNLEISFKNILNLLN